MDIIYKTLITLLSLTLLLSTGFALTLSAVDEIETIQYFDSATRLLAESNYSEETISYLIDNASEQGFFLSIEVYDSHLPGFKKYASVTLNYTYRIPLFKITLDRTKHKII